MLTLTRQSPLPEVSWAWLNAYLFMWTVISVVAATTSFIALGATTFQQWLFYIYSMLVYFYAWGALAFLIYWLTGQSAVRRYGMALTVCTHLGFLVFVSIALAFLIHPLTWRAWLYGNHAIGFHSLNTFLYSFILVGSLMLRYYRVSRSREQDAIAAEMRSYELQKDLSQARVNALRSQINPHFLFNTLNAIASLIETSNNAEAARVTGLLGSLLRTALEETSTAFIRLEQELEFLRRYVQIEQIRFGEKFVFQQQVESDCLDLEVPSLILQPLVENAVKYAVSPSSSPITVELRAERAGNFIRISVADDGPGLPRHKTSQGVGLPNVRERLALLYGGRAQLELFDGKRGGLVVRLQLPVQRAASAAEEEAAEGAGA